MRALLLVLSLAGVALAGCGGGDNSDGNNGGTGGTGGGGGNTAPTVHAGDRLVWDQAASSLEALRSYTFRLYVDGVRGSLNATNCASTAAAIGYECSGALPALTAGLHSLELTTVTAAGVESTRSAPFSVMFAPASTVGGLSSNLDESGRPFEVVCIGDGGTECYEPSLVASGVHGADSFIITANEQMLFIEGERVVRVIEGHQLAERPALVVDAGRLLALAVPADFDQSRFVYTASSTPSATGDEELSISRYREVQGTLAEHATIVTGLALPVGASAQLAIDSKGLLYLSMPYRDRDVRSPGDASPNTAILRFQPDGTVPSANPGFSPVIAHGYAHPSALVWDAAGHQLWLAGSDSRTTTPVATLQTEANARAPWPWSPIGVVLEGVASEPASTPHVTMTTDRGGQSRTLWVVPAPGQVYRARVESNDRQLPLARVMFGTIADVATVVGGPGVSLVLLSESAQPSVRSSRIWRLDRIVPKAIRLS
jgi:hypothetical protein